MLKYLGFLAFRSHRELHVVDLGLNNAQVQCSEIVANQKAASAEMGQ